MATSRFYVKFGRQIKKRFSFFDLAERFLIGVRYAVDQNTFDPRDYQTSAPLGFRNLSEQWLAIKKNEVKPSSYRNLKRYINAAIDTWDNRNIKEIDYAQFEDFLNSQTVSDKTKSNIKSCLHSFWMWLRKRKIITLQQFPEFPAVKFNLGKRMIIDKDTQEALIDEVKKLTIHINPKIWLGIKWLATYIAIRPGELVKMKEKDVNTKLGVFFVRHTKEGKEKLVPILSEDKEIIENFPAGLPDLYFFRHPKGISGCQPGQKFGEKYLYKWWKKACSNLGIDGVDLYGGTRHSSASALREFLSPEQIKLGTMHSTNKAFERYFQTGAEDALRVFKLTSGGTTSGPPKRGYRNR
ncbi:MAG: tyrosine-type recombinase/integrase [Proteobacteria bacterium]|nr:tyrosine-type recombinase/integrase [Pseudomonadota bacterium]